MLGIGKSNRQKEIDYLEVLQKGLLDDIRILGGFYQRINEFNQTFVSAEFVDDSELVVFSNYFIK